MIYDYDTIYIKFLIRIMNCIIQVKVKKYFFLKNLIETIRIYFSYTIDFSMRFSVQ